MQRGHQRHTIRFDAFASTVEQARVLGKFSRVSLRISKALQRKKQRVHDKKVCEEGVEGE